MKAEAVAHDNEYHGAMIAVLELVWGAGFMAPGGKGNVDRMVAGLDLEDRRVLDIGSGIGGPAIVLARDHGARVTGTDLEAPLVAKAVAYGEAAGLQDRLDFRVVEAGPMPFADESFDVVFSSGAFTQIDDKEAMFAQCVRVLKPGGWVTVYDWLKAPGDYSADMRRWFELEGLTYAMRTLEAYEAVLKGAGLVEVAIEDASGWYRREVRVEYDKLKGPLYEPMVELIGRAEADHFVENWRAMTVVCERGEMRQGYCRGRKPAVGG